MLGVLSWALVESLYRVHVLRATGNVDRRSYGILGLRMGLLGLMQGVRDFGDILDPPHVPPLRALWSALDGIWGFLKGT